MRWLVVMVIVAGCRDDLCDGAKPYCTGNVVHRCDDQHDNMQWETTTCEAVCVEDGERAFCASEATPRAACEGVAAGTTICDGAQRLTCLIGGYVTIRETCAAADLCQPDLPRCTVLPGPIAECAARMPSPGDIVFPASFCMGTTAIQCQGPYAIHATTCTARCEQSAHYGGCAQAMPDPICNDPTAVYPYPVCRDNTSMRCLGSYILPDFTLGCFSGTCLASGGCQG